MHVLRFDLNVTCSTSAVTTCGRNIRDTRSVSKHSPHWSALDMTKLSRKSHPIVCQHAANKRLFHRATLAEPVSDGCCLPLIDTYLVFFDSDRLVFGFFSLGFAWTDRSAGISRDVIKRLDSWLESQTGAHFDHDSTRGHWTPSSPSTVFGF